MRRGRREGQGALRFDGSCSSYEGEWRRGLRHGHGRVVFPESRASRPATTKSGAEGQLRGGGGADPAVGTGHYEGCWKDDLRHGQGTIVYPTGSKYVGEWHCGDKQGHGRMEWAGTGQVYEGEWDKGLPTGWGTLLYGKPQGQAAPGGGGGKVGGVSRSGAGEGWGSEFRDHLGQQNCYVGQFRNGMRHGVGTFYYSTGAHYSGDWVENVKCGQGIFTFENGTTHEGRFDNDRPVDAPLAQGPSMQLAVDDILAEEVGAEQQRRAVTNLLLRYNSEIRDTYRYYSDMSQGVEKLDEGMSWGQFLRMCKDSRIPCSVLSTSRIESMVADVCARAALHGIAPGARASGPCKHLLFRVFLECIVRAAHIKYHGMDQLDRRIHQLLNNNILPHAGSHRRSTPLPDSSGFGLDQAGMDLLHENAAALRDGFEAAAELGGVSRREADAARSVTRRQLLKLLKLRGLLRGALTAQAAMRAACDPNESDPEEEASPLLCMGVEMSYDDFVGAIVRCSRVADATHAGLQRFLQVLSGAEAAAATGPPSQDGASVGAAADTSKESDEAPLEPAAVAGDPNTADAANES